ncbi:unnamed protein product [Plutella xylostella]|uniref:Dynamin-like GTPase OPA1, mitochondrial n=1 Tax=Plutella xylostella TaxID=51655 RepID=A0A8S4G1R5_PLUXY|nr:unnamed protein product [Plutella xylostella]
MSRILHNRMRSSLKRSNWSCVDKRAVAFSVWTGRSMLLRRPVDTSLVQRRRYGMLVARAVRGLLKIRYLKYAEWKDGLPDMGWLNDLLPDNDQWDRFTTTLISAREKIGDNLQIGGLRLSLTADPRLAEAGAARARELRVWLERRYEDAVAAAAATEGQSSRIEPAPKLVNNLQSRPAAPTAAASAKEETSAMYEKRIHVLQDEVLSLQARYQRELQRLEQENRELRQQNMLLKQGRQPSARKMKVYRGPNTYTSCHYVVSRLEQENRELRQQKMLLKQGRQCSARKMKRSLIDMYSSVLDSLTTWDGGADRLPRVVVVGDQYHILYHSHRSLIDMYSSVLDSLTTWDGGADRLPRVVVVGDQYHILYHSHIYDIRSLIDMYSSVLDSLTTWDGGADRLPRVVVVGDQSAGKTSVLEMIARARIFPRGQGQMYVAPKGDQSAGKTSVLEMITRARIFPRGQGQMCDQSAGKTSVLEMIARARIFPRGQGQMCTRTVLEMIARARIFPRGQGQMCTRAPVKVTLSEGPYHVAQFHDSSREFDLNKEADLVELRKEIELRMRNSVRGGRTVSHSVISLSVKGPGIQRMVLVDLPGVISTQTVDMASDTRDSIIQMSKQYMENPNAIILCIQDGSVDAERSNVTDLVAQCDPAGKRTIFVLTKVDLAEENLHDPNRIRRILEGKLFPMKALGYYAVVTGRSKRDDNIQSIHEYEQRFFRSSGMFKDGLIAPSQLTTQNLSLAVSDCFWKMVRATVEQQADSFKAMRFNLETEWKNTFPRLRELDRDELFERARAELLDQSASLTGVSAGQWEKRLHAALWEQANQRVLRDVYLPSAANAGEEDQDKFNTLVDIKLREWAENDLPTESIKAGSAALREEFKALMNESAEDTDPIYEPVKAAAVEEALRRHEWEDRAKDVLRVLQLNALQDRCVSSRQQWDAAVALMTTSLQANLSETDHQLKELTDRCVSSRQQWDAAVALMTSSLQANLAETEKVLKELTGPGFKDRWLYWKSSSEEQNRRAEVKNELERLGTTRPNLTYDEVVAVRDNLRRRSIEVDNDYIRETYKPVYLKNFLQRAMTRARDCKKSFYMYSQQNGTVKECCEVVMFWRVQQTLSTTANALRQQIGNREAARLDRELREVLDEMAADPELKQKLLSGRRVELAEELKKVRQVQEKLEEFIEQLSKEK